MEAFYNAKAGKTLIAFNFVSWKWATNPHVETFKRKIIAGLPLFFRPEVNLPRRKS